MFRKFNEFTARFARVAKNAEGVFLSRRENQILSVLRASAVKKNNKELHRPFRSSRRDRRGVCFFPEGKTKKYQRTQRLRGEKNNNMSQRPFCSSRRSREGHYFSLSGRGSINGSIHIIFGLLGETHLNIFSLCTLRLCGESNKMDLNQLSGKIIGAAIEVHKSLGPGLLESAYEECLCFELRMQEISFERQVSLPVLYKGKNLDCGYRIDLIVEHEIILELKAVDTILPIHKAQLLTYLKLSNRKLGFLLNFNIPLMRDGIHRMVNNL